MLYEYDVTEVEMPRTRAQARGVDPAPAPPAGDTVPAGQERGGRRARVRTEDLPFEVCVIIE